MKETGMLKRVLSLVLMLCMAASLLPASAVAEEERYGYLYIADSAVKNRVVNFRPTMKADGDYLDQLPEYTVVRILGEQTKSGAKWYYAQNLVNNEKGYFLGSYVQEMSGYEIVDWQASGSASYRPGGGSENITVTIRGKDGHVGYVLTTADATYAYDGDYATPLNADSPYKAGQIITYYAESVSFNGYDWVQINYNGVSAYLRSDQYKHSGYADMEGTYAMASALSVVGKSRGSVITTAADALLYLAPGGNKLTKTIPQGTTVPYYVITENVNGTNWALVLYDGVYGYISSTGYALVGSAVIPSPTAVPTASPDLGTGLGYIRLIKDKVNLRKSPSGTVLTEKDQDKLPLGEVLVYYSEIPMDGYQWAQVFYDGQAGYIRSDCYEKSDAYGNLFTAAPQPGTTAAPTAPAAGTTLGYVVLVQDDVYLRESPAGTVLNLNDKMPLGQVLAYIAGPVPSGKYQWVKVTYHGMTGYVRSDCFAYCDELGNRLDGPAPTGAVSSETPAPSETPTPVYGEGTYGRTTMDKVMFRKTMSTNGDYWARLPKDWVVEVLGSDKKGEILWYKVRGGTPSNPDGSHTGYIHSDYLTIFTGSSVTPAPSTGLSGYAVITVDGINLRATPGGTAIGVLRSNKVVNVISVPSGSSANDWYYVETDGVYGYLPATALRELVTTELDNFTLPAAPAPTITPSPTPAFTGTGYVRLIKDKVNLRKTPGGTVLTPSDASKLPLNLVLAYSEGPTEKISGYSWVKVTYGGQTGYIRSDCYTQCYADGTLPTATSTPTPTPDASGSYIRLIKGGVNLRSGPWGKSYGQLDKGTVLPCYGTEKSGSETWYIVYSSELGTSGYILGTMAVTSDSLGNIIVPTIEPSATPGGIIGGGASSTFTGYVATSVSAVWVRSAAKTDASTVGKVQTRDTVLPMIGAAVTQLGDIYSWYPVQLSDGTRGYIRSDCVYELAQWQLDYYKANGVCPSPTPGPATPPPGNSEYVKIHSGSLWVRKTPSKKASTIGQLADGTVTKYYNKQNVGEITWYQVLVNGNYGWIHGDYARVLTNAEYYAWKGTEAPTGTPTAMPDPSIFSDLGITTIERVKIRASGAADGKQISMIYTEGSEFAYLGSYTSPTATNPYYWFKIKYQGVTGWVRGDCVRILTQEEKQLYLTAGNPDAPKEATYRTLSKGSTGEDVTALQNKLVEKGYLTASYTAGYYDTATENAVIAFQKANGLTVDGLAGEITQHALFNTVPTGTYDGSSTSVTLFPVEYVDWYTGDIQSLWKAGTVAIITDVQTGISFRAQRLYGDNHADAEPLTTADTDAICRIFGVSDAQEISDRQSELQAWRRRPLWVTIGNRTFAASMYGVPHNFSGDRIPDNNYNGQFCVHFTNSKTHGSGSIPARVDYDYPENGYYGHQTAIKDAYNKSISGNK